MIKFFNFNDWQCQRCYEKIVIFDDPHMCFDVDIDMYVLNAVPLFFNKCSHDFVRLQTGITIKNEEYSFDIDSIKEPIWKNTE